MYNSAVFCRVTQLCNRHQCLIPEHSCHPQRNPMLVTVRSSAPGSHSFTSRPYDFDSASYKRNPALWSWCLTACPQHLVFAVCPHRGVHHCVILLLQGIEMPPRGYSFINWWMFGLFLFLLLWITLLWTIAHKILCGRVFPFLSGLELGIEGLGPRVTLCLICWGTANRLSKELAPS